MCGLASLPTHRKLEVQKPEHTLINTNQNEWHNTRLNIPLQMLLNVHVHCIVRTKWEVGTRWSMNYINRSYRLTTNLSNSRTLWIAACHQSDKSPKEAVQVTVFRLLRQ